MRVFLDTNVVVDFLAERQPFYTDMANIIEMNESGIISASISALTVVNCAYILRKAYSKKVMLDKIEMLCDAFDITSIDRNTIIDSVKKNGADFEDTVQYYSAMQYCPDVIITRDKKGFEGLDILVMTPTEFVAESRK